MCLEAETSWPSYANSWHAVLAVCLRESSPWKTAEAQAYFEKHRNSLMPRSFLEEAKFGVHNEKLSHFRIKKC